MSTYAITGTSRGIGLEMVRQLVAQPVSKTRMIVAITRNKNPSELDSLIAKHSGRIINVAIPDITEESSVRNALPELEKALPQGLDVLINNAGVTDQDAGGLPNVTVETLMSVIKTNVGSVQAVTAALLPLLQKGGRKTVLNISTALGSIGKAATYSPMPNYCYKVSKSALNMLTTQYSLQYGKEGFTFMLVSPGWLKTELGGGSGDLEVDVGVSAVLAILERADTSYNGKFWNIKADGPTRPDGQAKYDGAELPW